MKYAEIKNAFCFYDARTKSLIRYYLAKDTAYSDALFASPISRP